MLDEGVTRTSQLRRKACRLAVIIYKIWTACEGLIRFAGFMARC